MHRRLCLLMRLMLLGLNGESVFWFILLFCTVLGRSHGVFMCGGFYCRYDSTSGGEREIQRTMLELLNQLDGFDSRGDVKVLFFLLK